MNATPSNPLPILRHRWFTPLEYLQGDAEACLYALERRDSDKAHRLLISTLKVNGFDCPLARAMLRAANCIMLGNPLLAMDALNEGLR